MTTLALLAAGALWGAVSATPPDHRPYPDLLREFRARRDSGLVAALAAYRRRAPDGRRWEVAYMLAATKCRSPSAADRRIGARLMQAFRTDYARDLASAGKAKAADAAHRACLAPVETSVASDDGDWFEAAEVRFSTGAGGAGVVASGKAAHSSCDLAAFVPAFRGFDGEAPREIVEQIEARLFRRADTAAAVRAARARLAGTEGTWRVQTDGRFVLATSGPQTVAQRQRILDDLRGTAAFLERAHGLVLPDTLVTAYLVPQTYQLQRLARDLHGIRTGERIIGYSLAADASLAAVIPGTTTGTLHHELTHLALRRTIPDAPPWLDEGLAALYEVAERRDGRLVGLPNWRGKVIRMYAEFLPAREELLGADWAAFDGEPFAGGPRHAMARYLVLFLQEHGWLPAVVRGWRARDPFADLAEGHVEGAVPSPLARGDAVLAQATGLEPAELWRRFEPWLEGVLPPPERYPCRKPTR